ncbi:hypothetical protein [Rhodococcus sp. NBC_00294]|uniref:hypothetical protein n=1 Tax=Rhodococcus sp. NBC_00294 TaxID=2976004 RepID=UPI002E2E86B2|nr:hypothetical protein [Rhodococcus sp. NBC_00294]
MRERAAVAVVMGIAAAALAGGLTVAAAGGVFDADVRRVSPPPIDGTVAVVGSLTYAPTIEVPPSPTWQIAPVTTPRPTTTPPPTTTAATTADEPTTTTRRTRTSTTTTTDADDAESGNTDSGDN